VPPFTGLAAPIRLSPIYDDQGPLWDLVCSRGRYPIMAGAAGFGEYDTSLAMPWFREYWALDGKGLFPEAEKYLRYSRFIDGARELFGVEDVRPVNLLVNLMGPMRSGHPHVDTPSFRGLKRAETPLWLLLTMGASGLFDRWRIRQAGVISWFYRGSGGDFQYWPAGPEGPKAVESPPFGNVAVVADNDYMPHCVSAIGSEDNFVPSGVIRPNSELHLLGDKWHILEAAGTPDLPLEDGAPGWVLPLDAVRVSVLWKADALSPDEADVIDRHDDDLDLSTVVDIFRADMRTRGFPAPIEADALGDVQWARLLREQ
jgi:hypothetical protein